MRTKDVRRIRTGVENAQTCLRLAYWTALPDLYRMIYPDTLTSKAFERTLERGRSEP